MPAALILVLSVVLFRLLVPAVGGAGDAVWANFSPVVALVLCGALFLPRRWALGTSIAMIVASDVLLNLRYGYPPVTAYSVVLVGVLGVVFATALRVRGRGLGRLPMVSGWLATLGMAMAASVFFYLATNTFSFFASSAYPPTLAGWWQCVTIGTPGFPPTYLFFRNALAGDLLFTAMFLLVLRPFRSAVDERDVRLAAAHPAATR